ncbi:MAG: hypothetical protein ABFD75_16210 [Smithella sp.]
MATTYTEIMIKGEPALIKGFVIGFLEGRGDKGDTFVEEERIEEDSPLEMILHFFTGHLHLVPVIAETGMVESLCKALQNRKEEIPSEVVSVRNVTGAFFEFKYKTFSEGVGKSLLAFFSDLPSGIQMKTSYKPTEKITPEGKGVEAYAPLHDYELKGSGVVQGGVKEIYNFYCRAGLFEVVELGKLTLEYGTASA